MRSRDADHSSRHEQLSTRPWRVVRGLGVGRPDPAAGEGWSPSDRCGPTPQAGTDPASLGDLTADANHVRAVLDSLDEPVVLVGHSYGGMVITELADHPKVRHSVYLAAFWPQRGQSLLDLIGDGRRRRGSWRETTARWRSPKTSSLLEMRSVRIGPGPRPREFSRVVPHSAAAMGTRARRPTGGHPTTYMIAVQESDNSIPGAAQEAMAANADEVIRWPAAHMVQLSGPTIWLRHSDGSDRDSAAGPPAAPGPEAEGASRAGQAAGLHRRHRLDFFRDSFGNRPLRPEAT